MPEGPEEEGGPEMLSYRALAQRLVADGIVERMTHQRLSQIAREDPDFPPVIKVGRTNAVDYRLAGAYFRKRRTRPGWRSDLKGQPPAASE
ncbi:hypothetical protein [Streptomyces sp. MJP52]|uniref:hypothetical protein n=1 Tax=Streptomyces sp. MJP52 TaxID=2940555 RepID=UPI002474095D|nr:hypothetical protein [Streptomyces sp. MJP52]